MTPTPPNDDCPETHGYDTDDPDAEVEEETEERWDESDWA